MDKMKEIKLEDLTRENIAEIFMKGIKPVPEFVDVLMDSLPYVADYCKKHNTCLVDVYGINQNKVFQPAFLFLGEGPAKTYKELRAGFGESD